MFCTALLCLVWYGRPFRKVDARVPEYECRAEIETGSTRENTPLLVAEAKHPLYKRGFGV